MTNHSYLKKQLESSTSRAIMERVVEVAGELDCTPAQVALAWTLLNPAVASPIIGARTYAQFEDNLGALDVHFSAEQLQRLQAVSAVEPCFPQSMYEGQAAERMFGGVSVEFPGARK